MRPAHHPTRVGEVEERVVGPIAPTALPACINLSPAWIVGTLLVAQAPPDSMGSPPPKSVAAASGAGRSTAGGSSEGIPSCVGGHRLGIDKRKAKGHARSRKGRDHRGITKGKHEAVATSIAPKAVAVITRARPGDAGAETYITDDFCPSGCFVPIGKSRQEWYQAQVGGPCATRAAGGSHSGTTRSSEMCRSASSCRISCGTTRPSRGSLVNPSR